MYLIVFDVCDIFIDMLHFIFLFFFLFLFFVVFTVDNIPDTFSSQRHLLFALCSNHRCNNSQR